MVLLSNNILKEKLSSIQLVEEDYLEFINQHLGLVIQSHQMNDLRQTILSACDKFSLSPSYYLSKLQEGHNKNYLEHLIQGITVGETYFFRDKKQMMLLKERILPELIQKKIKEKNQSLRIWSAGCSSGEEIYTIAMLIHSLLPKRTEWTFNLLGTDLNTDALQRAKHGAYSAWSMRSIPDDYLNRYFHKKENKYFINDFIKGMVAFDYLNLMENSYPSILNGTNAQDLILCRNVLIYFAPLSQQRTMKFFNLCLNPAGFLMLGASDPIHLEDTQLKYCQDTHGLFVKAPNGLNERTKKQFTQVIEKKIKSNHLEKTAHQVTFNLDREKVQMLLNQGAWNDTITYLHQGHEDWKNQYFFWQAKATALANKGELDEALNCCQKALEINKTDEAIYFTEGLIFLELKSYTKAELSFRKCLFLNWNFVLGHFQLGLLLLKQDKKDEGLRFLRNALLIVNQKDEKESVLGVSNMKYGELATILKEEVKLYKN